MSGSGGLMMELGSVGAGPRTGTVSVDGYRAGKARKSGHDTEIVDGWQRSARRSESGMMEEISAVCIRCR